MHTVKRVLIGFATIFTSLQFVLSHSKLIIFSVPSILWSFFGAPVLLELSTKHNFLNLPGYVYVFVFSFVGLIIFNFIYLGISYFHLSYLEKKHPLSLLKCVGLSWGKMNQVISWALVSALIGTSFFHTSTTLEAKTDILSYVFFEALETFWWLINFLIIPVFTGNHSVAYAASWAIKAIVSEPSMILGAGGGLLLLKSWLGKLLFYQVIVRTPFLLAYFNLVTFHTTDRAFVMFVLLPVIGILVATCISVVLSAVEATLASSLYAKFIGRAPEFQDSDFWRLFVMAILVFVVFVLLAFSVATAVIVLSASTPQVKNIIMSLLS